ncbi:MAG: hypothetical protein A2W37_02680 [Chloroflexi bacterium RBG_16_63_12]|jgi:hypothetical protein|nr:hypothetical protein [Anaerolineales bacterium]OGO44131.1 MAG: hypothetical protein A2W37_02680 [Chloroflexi bacterium RBG_16_63_12]
MQLVTGYLLIILGVVMEIISVLVWLGVLKPVSPSVNLQAATVWDVLLVLAQKAPWTAVVGLFLIYAGLKLVGVTLPF